MTKKPAQKAGFLMPRDKYERGQVLDGLLFQQVIQIEVRDGKGVWAQRVVAEIIRYITMVTCG
jgi:hypothetical protein